MNNSRKNSDDGVFGISDITVLFSQLVSLTEHGSIGTMVTFFKKGLSDMKKIIILDVLAGGFMIRDIINNEDELINFFLREFDKLI